MRSSETACESSGDADVRCSETACESSVDAESEEDGLAAQLRALMHEVLPGSQVERLESPAPRLPACAIAVERLPIRVWVRTADAALVEVLVTIGSVTR